MARTQMDTGTLTYSEPEIPAGVERTCPPATPCDEIRAGDRIVYQLDRPDSVETEDTVAGFLGGFRGRVIVTVSGEEVPPTAYVRVVHRDDAHKTPTQETTMSNVSNETANKVHYRRELVKAVNELIDAEGSMLTVRSAVERVCGTELAATAKAAGATLTRASYDYWRGLYRLDPTTTKHEMIRRAAAIREGKAGGTDTDAHEPTRTGTDGVTTVLSSADATPVRLPVVDCEGNALALAGGRLPNTDALGIRAAEMVRESAKFARRVASQVEGEIREGTLAMAAEERIGRLIDEEEGTDPAVRGLAVRQACHLVAAYLRGREDRPAETTPAADVGAVCDALQEACTRAAEGLRTRADGLLAAVGLIVAELRGAGA